MYETKNPNHNDDAIVYIFCVCTGIAIFTTKKNGVKGSTGFDEGGGKLNAEKYHQTMIEMAETMTGAYSTILADALK